MAKSKFTGKVWNDNVDGHIKSKKTWCFAVRRKKPVLAVLGHSFPSQKEAEKAMNAVLHSVRSGDGKRVMYMVEGSSGEYDDYRTWEVAQYLSKEMAESHAKLAQKFSKQLFRKYQEGKLPEQMGEDKYPFGITNCPKKYRNPWDKENMDWHAETSYHVYPVEILDEVPSLAKLPAWWEEPEE